MLELPARVAADYLSGRADLVGALRRGEATVQGSRERALVLLSTLGDLVRPSDRNAHRRPLPPLR